MMATDNSQYISPLSLSIRKPQQPQNQHPVNYKGSFITLVSKYGLRYEGFFYYFNQHDKTLCLTNVICYGTEGMDYTGFQIPRSYELYSYIVFTTTQIQNVIVSFPASLESGLGSKIYRAPKPPLPYKFSPYSQHGAKIRQKVPLLTSYETFSKTEATDDYYDASLIEEPVNDGLEIACKPLALQQYPGSNYYDDPWLNHVYQPPMPPASLLYQDLTNTAPSWIAPQSFFTTDPPVPISLRPANGGFDFEALKKNFKPYKLWGPEGDNNKEDQTAFTVDGSSYQNETWSSQGNNNLTAYNTIDWSFNMNTRNPFDPIGRPWNPFGPIERPFSYDLPSSHELADLGFV